MNRKIDSLGRIVIPMEIRKELGIEINDTLYFDTRDNEIIISKKKQSLRDYIIELMLDADNNESVSDILNKILDRIDN